MKNMLMILFLLVSLSLETCSGTRKAPQVVIQAFNSQYPGVNARWEKEESNFEAEFEFQGKEMSMVFEENGTLLESEVEIKTEDLPSAALDYIRSHYSGKKIKETAKITKPGGEITFEAEIDGIDIMFNQTGKFLKEIKK